MFINCCDWVRENHIVISDISKVTEEFLLCKTTIIANIIESQWKDWNIGFESHNACRIIGCNIFIICNIIIIQCYKKNILNRFTYTINLGWTQLWLTKKIGHYMWLIMYYHIINIVVYQNKSSPSAAPYKSITFRSTKNTNEIDGPI